MRKLPYETDIGLVFEKLNVLDNNKEKKPLIKDLPGTQAYTSKSR